MRLEGFAADYPFPCAGADRRAVTRLVASIVQRVGVDLDEHDLLRAQPRVKGRELTVRLSADKSEINSTLWSLKNRGLTRQDNAYRW